MERFSDRLRKLRTKRKLRQIDLAEELGLAQTTIANYEHGTRFPDEETLSRIADFFDISLDYLLGRSRTSGPFSEKEMPDKVDTEEGGLSQTSEQSSLAYEILAHLRSGEQEEAKKRLLENRDRGVHSEEIYLHILEPLLKETGRLYETGQIDIFQEHIISNSVLEIMASLSGTSQKPRIHKTFLGLVPPGESHYIGIKMVCDFLSWKGWLSVYLGSDLPFSNINQAVTEFKADLLGLSVTNQSNINTCKELIEYLRPEHPYLKVIVGGQAFTRQAKLWKNIGADAYAGNAFEAVGIAEKMASIR